MTTRQPQIIAIGGAGLALQDQPPLFERYILAQTRKVNPAVCFIPTASGDADENIVRFYGSFSRLRCRPTHLRLFDRTPDLRRVILAQDVIYVGGGNTKSMLAVWRDWGVDRLLRAAWRRGIVLTGASAGAICWFSRGVTDSWANHLALLDCLGFLPGTCCPHYDGEAERRPSVHRMIRLGRARSVLALDDGVAAHFAGRRLLRTVAARPSARGYEVRRGAGQAIESLLPVRHLTDRAPG